MTMVQENPADSYAPSLCEARLPNGIRLRYVQQGPADGSAIIMLHGYTDSWYSFSRALPLLPSAFRAIVPDQRGHGGSDRPPRGYSMDDFAGDVLALMNDLQISTATVVGHSMGSFVARRLAAIAPDRLSGLVLVGAGVSANTPAVAELGRAVERLTDPVDLTFVREFQVAMVYNRVPDAFLTRVVTNSARVPAFVWKDAFAGLIDERSIQDIPSVPTLVLGGNRDTVFSEADQRALADRIPGAAVRIVPDIGHSLQWEDPGRFVTELFSFTRSLARKSLM